MTRALTGHSLDGEGGEMLQSELACPWGIGARLLVGDDIDFELR